ncbi:DUF5916 domain-containing protein [Soonwooa sp.]|uniref:DUF5916 domain-containing protein n=1 Tax=Soonwooa sp. TaxID=1938592 RepID=UPI0028ACE415|nr:DUF5916 domain-containing protein [Soonwooa sp.]
MYNIVNEYLVIVYSNFVLNHNNQFQYKKFENYSFRVEVTPFGQKDNYEPCAEGRFLNVPSYFNS